MPLNVTITTEQKVLVHAVPTSAAGNEVASDEPVAFAVTSGTVTLAPNDATSQFIVSGASPESATVSITDASGALTDVVNVLVSAPVATHFVESADAPVTK